MEDLGETQQILETLSERRVMETMTNSGSITEEWSICRIWEYKRQTMRGTTQMKDWVISETQEWTLPKARSQ